MGAVAAAAASAPDRAATARRPPDAQRDPLETRHGRALARPERYGLWPSVYTRFRRWTQAGVWDQLFAAVQQQAEAAGALDWELHFMRVALGPPVCRTTRDDTEQYQLAMSYEPALPTATSLLSFNAFLSPPYTDLYEFAWEIDGVGVPDVVGPTLQLAVSDLPTGTSNQHRARVRAIGVREYPDPDPALRQMPPTLTVECGLQVQ